jgi:outer membrane lipoprotein-sorting protein
MRPSDNTEKLIKKLRYKASTEMHVRIFRNALQALDKTEKEQSGVITPNIWRIIMKSPITKLAAAAAIIIVVLIGLHQIGGSTPAFAEIIQPFLTARTAAFQMTMQVEGAPTQTFDCYYSEPIRMRQISKEQDAIVISDLLKGKIISLIPAQKRAFVIELENMPEDRDQSEFNMFAEIRKHIIEAQESEDASVEFLGENKINGLTVIGYHVRKPGLDMTIWADPQTKLPVQITNTTGPVTYTMTDIVFDVELDESLFSLDIPDDYTVHTRLVDASEPTEEDLVNMFYIWAEYMDGNFPSAFERSVLSEFMQYQRQKMKDQGIEPTEESVLDLQNIIQEINRGGMFVMTLPADSNWHYAGKDVKFGQADKPIFWYKPEGSEIYRVIYGDLRVEDVAPENLPE